MRTTEFMDTNGKLSLITYKDGAKTDFIEDEVYIEKVIAIVRKFDRKKCRVTIKNGDLTLKSKQNKIVFRNYKLLQANHYNVRFILNRLVGHHDKVKLQQKSIAAGLALVTLATGVTVAIKNSIDNTPKTTIETLQATQLNNGKNVDLVEETVSDAPTTEPKTEVTTEPTTVVTTEVPVEKITAELTTKKETPTKKKTSSHGTFEQEVQRRYNVGSALDAEKYQHVMDNYSDIIGKYCDMYGLNTDLMIAIATQEKGYHSSEIKNGMVGLMQVNYSVHVGKTKKVFNVQKNCWESVKITDEMVRTLEGNIQAGCIIFQNEFYLFDENYLASMLAYNMGQGNFGDVLDRYCYANGVSRSEALDKNLYDIDDYTSNDYLADVLRYYDGDISDLRVENTK